MDILTGAQVLTIISNWHKAVDTKNTPISNALTKFFLWEALILTLSRIRNEHIF